MRALDDLRVISVGQIYNGPYCTLLLSFLGADVIKVEPPGGENVRSRDAGGESPEAIMLNSGKRSITLDLKSDRGKELFERLVEDADVLVENYSVGTMERLGLGYEHLAERNPELIYAHGSGYGESGPYTDYPAMDLTIQAMTGVMDVTGFTDQPPVKAGVQVADFFGGIHLAAGVLAALYQRQRTDEGQFVEVSMMDAVYPTLLSPLAAHYREEEVPPRTGNRHSGLAVCPYNVYETSDGYIAILCANERHWERLRTLIGDDRLADEEAFGTNEKRRDRMDEVDSMIEEWTRNLERDELAEGLLKAGVPCGPVRDVEEVLYDPHLEERGMVTEIGHPDYGTIRVPGLPMKLRQSSEPEIAPAESAGASTEEVLREVGVPPAEIEELSAADVI